MAIKRGSVSVCPVPFILMCSDHWLKKQLNRFQNVSAKCKQEAMLGKEDGTCFDVVREKALKYTWKGYWTIPTGSVYGRIRLMQLPLTRGWQKFVWELKLRVLFFLRNVLVLLLIFSCISHQCLMSDFASTPSQYTYDTRWIIGSQTISLLIPILNF